MVRLTKKVEYALIAILYIAQKSPGELTSARELSSHFSIPPELLGKVLQRLARHKIIESVQGVKGGYQLQSSLDRVKISDVVTAVDGPIRVVSCVVDRGELSCGQIYFCNIKKSMENIQSRLIEFFDSITLKELQEGKKILQKSLKRPGRSLSIPLQIQQDIVDE